MKITGILLGLYAMSAVHALAAESAPQSPAEQVTRPCRAIESVRPAFPAAMLHAGEKFGTVQMLLEIGVDGQLTDALVTAHTGELYAEEAMRAVKKWKFEASLVRGQPVISMMNITLKFEAAVVAAMEHKDITGAPMESGEQKGFVYQARGLKKLDNVPEPVKMVQPVYPLEWSGKGIVGKVFVDFYIDETGKVRMPSCPSGTLPQLAGIAMDAVLQWQFTPPTWKGKPALAHARQVFDFGTKQ